MINCASASGPFINRLSGPNRVVVAATKSGFEMNFTRFGQYLAETIADPRADLDKDGQVSLLEAYLTPSSRVEEYYRAHSQLASEHALLDDNGDKLGTPASWFKGVRATQRAKDGAALDGIRAHQLHLIPSDRERGMPVEMRQRRDELESSIAALRDQKEKLKDDEYYARLEKLMVELARLYRDVAIGWRGQSGRWALSSIVVGIAAISRRHRSFNSMLNRLTTGTISSTIFGKRLMADRVANERVDAVHDASRSARTFNSIDKIQSSYYQIVGDDGSHRLRRPRHAASPDDQQFAQLMETTSRARTERLARSTRVVASVLGSNRADPRSRGSVMEDDSHIEALTRSKHDSRPSPH